ncbi:hypothetical protein RJ640_002765 [Escallonia rubra]|uniref:Trichome birefringence-like N-terminal domain-containing protein n=1 Tax=Escallonia rubra TaxID=112253 RepID=A0AA88R805_9ASTE|nr:hypothetical protein RJ640_002765 [Escallonia rubra]
MSERQRLCFFIDGLQQWFATELRRREPHDLAFAMVIFERLGDFKQRERPRSPRHERAKDGGDGRSKSGSPKAIDDERSGDKVHRRHHKEEKKHEGSHKHGNSRDHKARVGPRRECFYCACPHYGKDCPHKGKMIAFLEKHKSSKGDSSRSYGEARIGALQMVNAFHYENDGDSVLMMVRLFGRPAIGGGHGYEGGGVGTMAIGFGYSYLFPGVQPIIENFEILKPPDNLTTECNYFEGKWVYDENYPLYNASECPFVECGFSCLANGRKDKEYLKWRWKPNDCDIPNFNVSVVLEKLRGKRIVFIGDSLSRNQWESMICLLMTGVEDKNSVYEVNGHKITIRIKYLSVRFKSFKFTIEFYRSVYLVHRGSKPKSAPKRVKFTLQLDKLDDISAEWINSDILIFGTGNWRTPGKLF